MNLPSSIWLQIEQLSNTLRCNTSDLNPEEIQRLLIDLRDTLGANDLVVCVCPADKLDWGLLLPDKPGQTLLGYLGDHPFPRDLSKSAWIVRQR